MIYGNRFYAFNTPIEENAEEVEARVESADIWTNDSILELALKDSNFAESLGVYCESVEADEVLEEGANQDYTDAAKKYLKEYKKYFGKGVDLTRQRQFEKASAEYKKAETTAKKFLEEIEKIKSDDLKSMAIGMAIGLPVVAIEVILSFAIPKIKALHVVIKSAIDIALVIDEAHTIVHSLKELIKLIKGEEKFTKWANTYKQLLGKAGKFLRDIAKLGYRYCDKKYE